MKIVKAKLVMQIDEELDDLSVEEIADGECYSAEVHSSQTNETGRRSSTACEKATGTGTWL